MLLCEEVQVGSATKMEGRHDEFWALHCCFALLAIRLRPYCDCAAAEQRAKLGEQTSSFMKVFQEEVCGLLGMSIEYSV